REHAARIVAAERDDDGPVLGAIFFLDIAYERLPASEPVWALRIGRAGRVETGQWGRIELAQQIDDRATGQLFAQLFIVEPRGIAGALIEAIGPAIIGRAIGAIAKRPELGLAFEGAVGVEIGVGGGVGDHIGHRYAERIVDLIGH